MASSQPWHYDRSMLSEALRSVGLESGDIVMSHVSLGFLGYPAEGATTATACQVVFNAFQDVLGPEGTWVVPTYSYSYCKNEVYDPTTTPSVVGPFTEYFRRLPGVQRSWDPIFSVAALGPQAETLLRDVPSDCFGPDCVYDRLRRRQGKICNVGVGLLHATFMHHIEQILGVPYRYRKRFSGFTRRHGTLEAQSWIYNVRVLGLGDKANTDVSRLENQSVERGVCRSAPVGRGRIMAIACQDMWAVCAENIRRNAWFLAAGPAADPLAAERRRTGQRRFALHLPREASMSALLETLWPLPRDLLSDGYDAALEGLMRQVPMRLHEYPSGTQCGTQLVPEKWSCQEAYLATLDGRRIFSYAEQPLHVASYSQPWDGEVGRDELRTHLTTHPILPDAIPYHRLDAERTWGLCCSQTTRARLLEEAYRVVIRTEYSYATLKVGEVIVPGGCDDSVLLYSHLDHPAQANDGLSGVVVGLEVMRVLLRRQDLRYTYRFLVGPGSIGYAAYLSHHAEVGSRLHGAIGLDRLGLAAPFVGRFFGPPNTAFERACKTALSEHVLDRNCEASRTATDVCGADLSEVPVPSLSLTRACRSGDAGGLAFPEHHSHLDTSDLVDVSALHESCDLLLCIIAGVEAG